MRLGYPAQAVREAEEPLLASGGLERLMRLAAEGLAAVCRRALLEHRGRVTGARVVILAGAGKNGGDAMLAGVDLLARGAHVTVIDVMSRPFQPAHDAYVRAGGTVRPLAADSARLLAGAELVLDGILGTGGRPGLPEKVAAMLRDWQELSSANRHSGTDRHSGASLHGSSSRGPSHSAAHPQLVIAVDMPTGVDATTGECESVHVRADRTVTFGACTSGLLLPGGAEAAGEVTLIDIGLDMSAHTASVEVPEPADLLEQWPFPQPHMHKYTRGVLGLIAGSKRYPGAGMLSTAGAVSTGVGMLRLLSAPEVRSAVVSRYPEVVTEQGRVQAWAVGPGAPDALLMRRALDHAEAEELPVVIDAAGIRMLTRPLLTGCIVTPHAGELVELLRRLSTGVPDRADVEERPVAYAVRAAQAVGGVVLLKGSRTIIARPDGTVVAPPPGPASLATAGTGDVLTGIIGALLATTSGDVPLAAERGMDLARLAGLAVMIHAAAGERTTHASGLPRALEQTVVELSSEGSA